MVGSATDTEGNNGGSVSGSPFLTKGMIANGKNAVEAMKHGLATTTSAERLRSANDTDGRRDPMADAEAAMRTGVVSNERDFNLGAPRSTCPGLSP